MTTSQALTMINHWLHPHQTDNEAALSPSDAPQPDPPEQTSSGCAGYQVGIGTILYQQQKLVEQVNEQLNLPLELQPLFDQTLDNLTYWLHLLPAHPQHHCGPAGAIRHALETAFWSVTAMQQIHSDHDLYPDQRRAREPLWRLMAGVAGLLYDSGRMTSCLAVQKTLEPLSTEQWPAFQQGLGAWLQQHRITNYSPQWKHCDTNPEKPLAPEYTVINLLLLPQITPQSFSKTLQPDVDNSTLWQTFVSALTGQKTGRGVSQIINAVELARLKSVKLHFVRGEALNHIMKTVSTGDQPVEKKENELSWLHLVISKLQKEDIKWAKDSLLLHWPDSVKSEELPDSDILLRQWNQRGWIKPLGNQIIFRRNGRLVIALQPVISQQCKQWLPADSPAEEFAGEQNDQ
ncbi:TraI domain-containing protein [Endozoicomonas arenosclerae]|uniref:TraI domain-containing protein n=1 Tax=Endozoicomonas arenosclerae TaxID=1633495 RepID=UPI0009A165DF|nr:TraI domain-containing protein [Endozoicomonas arenosclerae]